MFLDKIPAVAAEVSAPLSQVNGITFVADPNDKDSIGPAKLTKEVLNIVEKMPDVVTQMTGHKLQVR